LAAEAYIVTWHIYIGHLLAIEQSVHILSQQVRVIYVVSSVAHYQ